MGLRRLEDCLGLLGVPEVDGAVLTGSHKPLLVDGADSINSVVVTLVYHLCLLLGLPGDHLLVVARTDEVLSVEVVEVQQLGRVLIVSPNQTSLGHIPVL